MSWKTVGQLLNGPVAEDKPTPILLQYRKVKDVKSTTISIPDYIKDTALISWMEENKSGENPLKMWSEGILMTGFKSILPFSFNEPPVYYNLDEGNSLEELWSPFKSWSTVFQDMVFSRDYLRV